jgi:hypothetical protein
VIIAAFQVKSQILVVCVDPLTQAKRSLCFASLCCVTPVQWLFSSVCYISAMAPPHILVSLRACSSVHHSRPHNTGAPHPTCMLTADLHIPGTTCPIFDLFVTSSAYTQDAYMCKVWLSLYKRFERYWLSLIGCCGGSFARLHI